MIGMMQIKLKSLEQSLERFFPKIRSDHVEEQQCKNDCQHQIIQMIQLFASKRIKHEQSNQNWEKNDAIKSCIAGYCQSKSQHYTGFQGFFAEPFVHQIGTYDIPGDKNDIFVVIKAFRKKTRRQNHHQNGKKAVFSASEPVCQ